MKAATLKLDTEPPQQLDIAQMATFADSSNEVSKGEVAFKRAIQVLDLCTPDIGGEDAESTDPEIKLVRDALRERSEESQAKLAAFIGSDRRMSDQTLSDLRVYEEVHHTKQSLTESMEAVRRDWYPKVANILNKYRRMGEELLGKAITNGERFVTSSNAASDTMTLKAHQDRWQDSYNAVVEKTREIARLIQMSCSAHPSLGSDSVAEQNLELFEVIKKAKEAQ
ncbi:hypothetical protein I302_105664 [Kwoniella bestiolae CBS 10118]|uniref:Uncharacterized protein n=1 Tax=Kwoniella bestiolae CBS 10118 TaxID=1296100 RepID=A0A1B9G1S0_9TREE|nr:hypothetical protein I302_04782 [Kwoniella bestiolae CBS 10118]OCF24972.1 hypothetical protein I302_04782 [Kwoniella bestiolae CBS 10118]